MWNIFTGFSINVGDSSCFKSAMVGYQVGMICNSSSNSRLLNAILAKVELWREANIQIIELFEIVSLQNGSYSRSNLI